MKTLNTKLVGYYNYYGGRGNFKSLYQFYWGVEKLLFKWLNRRSQRQSFNQEVFTDQQTVNAALRALITAIPRLPKPKTARN